LVSRGADALGAFRSITGFFDSAFLAVVVFAEDGVVSFFVGITITPQLRSSLNTAPAKP
jgi:hypothetical protein